MKQIKYNDSSVKLDFEFPANWDVENISTVDISISNDAGSELLAATNISLYTQTTLDSAATRFDDSITLVAGADDLLIGNLILLVGANREQHVVKSFDSATKTATLENILDADFDAADNVYCLNGTYTLDTTTTTDFVKGSIVTVKWAPDTGDTPVTELYQIASTALDMLGIRSEFKNAYPRYYDLLTQPADRFSNMLEQARRSVYNELQADGLNIERIIDQSLIIDTVMTRLAVMSILSGDENTTDEREFLGSEYQRQIGILKKMTVWTDDNQDLKKTDDEVSTHTPGFSSRTW